MFHHIETYNHQSRIGVIVELRATESVTLKEAHFRSLASDIALHIASGDGNGEASGKQLLGLLAEPFVKNPEVSVLTHIKQHETQLKDSIRILRYVRYAIE